MVSCDRDTENPFMEVQSGRDGLASTTTLSNGPKPGIALALALLAGVVVVASPVTYVLTSSLTLASPNSQLQGHFGISVAVSGREIVVGAWNQTVGGLPGAGLAYVFNANTGALLFTLTNPNAQAESHFGFSVAVSGSRIMVGAWNETVVGLPGAGLAYIFNANTGALLFTLISPNIRANEDFGRLVTIGGNKAIVSSWQPASGNPLAGRVYVFNANTGALILTLISPNAQTDGDFGSSIAISGSKIVVGASYESASGIHDAGHAYVFNAKNGVLLLTLVSPNAQTDGDFGSSIAVSGDRIVVGATGETVSGDAGAGRAYVFNANTGALLLTLVSPNVQTGGGFGSSLAISGRIVVGASGETVSGDAGAGHAYVFNARTGALVLTLTSPNARANGSFGSSVAIVGNVIDVGAPWEAASMFGAGHAYVFKFGEA